MSFNWSEHFNWLIFSHLDSSNDEARRIAEREGVDSKEEFLVLADHQTKGRGKYGRSWDGEDNLTFSLLLRPNKPQEIIGELVFVTSVALAEALLVIRQENKLAEFKLELKWPNDVIMNGKKLAGILLEAGLIGKNVSWLVIGIGVNINTYPEGMMATSLRAENIVLSRQYLLEKFMDQFCFYYDKWQKEGFGFIRDLWLGRAYKLKERIEFTTSDGKKEKGIFLGIDEKGALLLQGDEEAVKRFSTGDIFIYNTKSQK